MITRAAARTRAPALALAALLTVGAAACEADGTEDSPAATGDPGDGVATEPVAPDGGMDAGTSSDAGMEDPGAAEGLEGPGATDGLEGGGMEDATMQDG